MPVKAPPPPAPVYSWNGFYVGGNIGGGWSDRNVSLTPNDSDTADIIAVLPAQPFKTNGVLGGVQLGYNWQFQPNWLLGFETDFDWSNLRGSSTVSGLFGGTETVTSTTSEHVNWFGTLRGRLGWLPWQNLLVYGTGGFAYGGVKHIGSIANSSSIGFASIGGLSCPAFATCLAGTSTSTATGWTAGGGVEWALCGIELSLLATERASLATSSAAIYPS
jgi:outer membrane immunogenic protein